MDDCSNGCRPVACQFLVLKKCEFHPAATEEVSGFECVRKTKAASRDPDAPRRPIGARTLQTRLMIVEDGEQIAGVLRHHPKEISGIELSEGKLFGIRFAVAISELLPV
jgi:hypothetical protein